MVGSQAAAALTRGVTNQLKVGKEKSRDLAMMKVIRVARRPIMTARVRRVRAILRWLTPIARRVPISGRRSRTLAKAR